MPPLFLRTSDGDINSQPLGACIVKPLLSYVDAYSMLGEIAPDPIDSAATVLLMPPINVEERSNITVKLLLLFIAFSVFD